jgi:hypothetical protein
MNMAAYTVSADFYDDEAGEWRKPGDKIDLSDERAQLAVRDGHIRPSGKRPGGGRRSRSSNQAGPVAADGAHAAPGASTPASGKA